MLEVPTIFGAEAVSAVRSSLRRGSINRAVADAAVLAIASLRIMTHPFEPFARRVRELRENVTVDDAWYVALAEALDTELVTADRRLVAAAGPGCPVVDVGAFAGRPAGRRLTDGPDGAHLHLTRRTTSGWRVLPATRLGSSATSRTAAGGHMTIGGIAAAAAGGAGDLVGGWDWPVLLLVPLMLALALLTALALDRTSQAGAGRRRQGGTSRALARGVPDRTTSD